MTYEYAVSFEIAVNATYSKRYGSLMEQIKKTPAAAVWAETTSFVLLRSAEDIVALADRLYYKSDLVETTDMLLVSISRPAHVLRVGRSSFRPH